MQTRHVSEKIPLSEVPFIMRALGFFPTEQEVNKLQYTMTYMLPLSLPRFVMNGRIYITRWLFLLLIAKN